MSFYNLIAPAFVDVNGGTSVPTMSLASQTPLIVTPYTTLLTAMQAASAMALFGVAQQLGAAQSGSPGTSTTPLSTDQLRLQLSSGSSTGYIIVPGPVPALFKSDGVTFNPSSTVSTNLIAAILAILGDPAGRPWTAVVGGTRRKVLVGPGGS